MKQTHPIAALAAAVSVVRFFSGGLFALFLTLVSGCDDRSTRKFARSPTTPTAIDLIGQVTDGTTSAPISGAIVRLYGRPHVEVTTDSSGTYRFVGGPPVGDITFVEANNYAADHRYVRGSPHNVHLYPITRITAGETTLLTVATDDTLCVNNMQDSPGLGPLYVCRSVRVVAPIAGVMTLEARSTTNGPPPLLEVEIVGGQGPCCSERLENPTSIQVAAGTEVVAHVEMPFGSATSQSFTLNTSIRPR